MANCHTACLYTYGSQIYCTRCYLCIISSNMHKALRMRYYPCPWERKLKHKSKQLAQDQWLTSSRKLTPRGSYSQSAFFDLFSTTFHIGIIANRFKNKLETHCCCDINASIIRAEEKMETEIWQMGSGRRVSRSREGVMVKGATKKALKYTHTYSPNKCNYCILQTCTKKKEKKIQ